MMNLTHVISFLAVIDTGSFRGAASRLGITQPAVSQHLRKLEESLGVKLIDRSRDRCVPYAEASEFVRHARTLLEVAERAKKSLSEAELVVGASSNVGIYLIQPAFKRFLDQSGARGRLVIDTNWNVATRLRSGEIDVAAMEWWDGAGGGVVSYRDEEWREEELIVVVSPDHRWAGRKTIPPAWLEEEEILGGEPGTGTGTILRQALGELAGKLRVTRNLGSTEAVKEGVKAGLGVSIVMLSSVAEEIHAGSLVGIRLRGVRLRKSIRLVRKAGLPDTSLPGRFCQSTIGA